MRKIALLVVCLCAVFGVASVQAKAIADSTAFQGSLTDVSNNPVPDGPRDLTISVWTDSVAGTMVYSEIRTVTTSKGLFTTCIGCGSSAFPDIFNGQTLFLQMQIAGQAPMTPRTRLRNSPSAMSASSLNADATQGSARARGIITVKPVGSKPTGRMLFDADADGNGIADMSAETNVSSDSATSVLTADADGDGVPEVSDRRTVSANEFHHNSVSRSGSTTATIRQIASPDSAETALEHDSNSDGIPETSDRRTVSANEFHHNSVSRSGSTTATIRQMVSQDSVVSGDEHDADGDGNPELYSRRRMINADAKLRTIMATDADDDGVANISAETEVGQDSASFRLNGLPPGTPYIGNLSMSASGGGAHQVLSGHSGSTTGTIRQMATPDSASVDCDADSDGDGHLEAAAVSSVTKLAGGGGGGAASASYAATGRLYVDNNSDGTPDNEIESIVTPTTSSVAINTKGTGADKNRVVSSTDDTSAVVLLGCDGASISMKVKNGGMVKGNIMINNSSLRQVELGSDGSGYFAHSVGVGTDATHAIDVSGGAYCDGTNWVNASDRNVKENFEQVNGEELLDKITQLPITKWNYKGDDKTEHIGPTAQDFQETFGVGSDGKSISTIDPSGIALAGIKELSKQNRELHNQNKELQKQNEKLKKQMDELVGRVDKLAAGK